MEDTDDKVRARIVKEAFSTKYYQKRSELLAQHNKQHVTGLAKTDFYEALGISSHSHQYVKAGKDAKNAFLWSELKAVFARELPEPESSSAPYSIKGMFAHYLKLPY